MTKIIKLEIGDIENILDVERKAFIPSIKTTEENIRNRLNKGHIYLGVNVENKLVGTLVLRTAYFVPDFSDFCRKNPTFFEYAEKDNERDANAVFVYSIGVIPQYRNGTNAKKLLQGAFDIAKQKDMKFIVGDARVPSYNGSKKTPRYEQFDKNNDLHKSIDEYLITGILPSRELIEQDPVAGFYLKVFQELKILGITDETFWKGDEPCGGHMIIEYLKLK